MTEWNEYRALDLERIRDLMISPLFIDLRNVYEPRRMEGAGFTYFGVGLVSQKGLATGKQQAAGGNR